MKNTWEHSLKYWHIRSKFCFVVKILLIKNPQDAGFLFGVPKGIRTPVAAVKGRCPRPLDDGDKKTK